MNYFKHYANASDDTKLVAIRMKFGMWGIGAYWILLEMVAAQMKAEDPTPERRFIVKELTGFFHCQFVKLQEFLEFLSLNCGWTWKKIVPTMGATGGETGAKPGLKHLSPRFAVQITIPELLSINE